jgi:hypothetical protein
MRKFVLPLALLFSGMFLFSSCLKDDCTSTRTFVQYDPVYMSEQQIRKDIETEAARELENPGKMYVYGSYVFVNELREGVHVLDNSDPRNPQNIGFINIPGNVDIAIKNNILFADNYMDLLALDISDVNQPELLYRDEDAFDHFYPTSSNRGRLVYYEETERTTEVNCNENQFNQGWFLRNEAVFVDATFNNSTTGGSVPSTGVGGSMARFTIAEDRLYTIDQQSLHVYNVSNENNPVESSDVHVGWGIETIFPSQGHLFIGANDGMYIYGMDNPDQPHYVSKFNHAQACDPVFVQDDIAYVTLRGGTECQNFTNQLDIIDIQNISNPKLLATHDMQHPHGLHVYNEEIIICEGKFGWKTFEMENPKNIDLIKHNKNLHAFDVIRLGDNHVLIVGSDGLYQYDLSDPDAPELLSEVLVRP